ncbi:MAG TPA: serine/threonine-protein kinase [Kofleriaceae bacterium]
MPVDPSAVTAAEPGGPVAPASQTLGKYRLDRVLGSGGMGVVWAAFDPDLERAVAIKLLHSESSEPTLRSRLLREARAMARLKHPNVVTVYEVGTDQNRDYIAMELVEGESLEEWLARKPPRAEILDALRAAGRGLAAAHAAGLVHRDFKPHNVLRSRDGHVYVTDFGLARGQIETDAEAPITGALRRDSVLDSPLTQTGILIGTPAYMAPEQFSGKAPDPRSDQFAFCVTAWEALTGERPFRGKTLEELEAAASSAPRSFEADLPPTMHEVLVRGLAANPDQRWPDMLSLLDALSQGEPVKKRKRLPYVLGGLAVCAAAGGVIAVGSLSSGTPEEELCMPAEKAFERAWSPARRNEFQRANPGGAGIGQVALLDAIKKQWVNSYTVACAAPRTPDMVERIRCLHAARERVADAVVSKAPANVFALATGVTHCDPEQRFDGLLRDMNIELDFDDLPEPPAPPAPPAPR